MEAMTRVTASGILGLALMAPGLSLAQGSMPGWYAGAGAGQASMRDEEQALVGTNFDDEDTAWKVFAGYGFHPGAAVELGYIDFGEFTGAGGGAQDNWEATGINLSALGSLPLANRFSVFGKVGATRWDVDDAFAVNGVAASASETGTDFSYGVGAQLDFAHNSGARVEWERFQDVGEELTTGRSDLDLLSVSVLFGF